MDPVSFRKSKNWSQADLGERLGVGSKGYISDLENRRQPWPLKLALKYEQVSEGLVKAADLCPEAADLLPASSMPEARAS